MIKKNQNTILCWLWQYRKKVDKLDVINDWFSINFQVRVSEKKNSLISAEEINRKNLCWNIFNDNEVNIHSKWWRLIDFRLKQFVSRWNASTKTERSIVTLSCDFAQMHVYYIECIQFYLENLSIEHLSPSDVGPLPIAFSRIKLLVFGVQPQQKQLFSIQLNRMNLFYLVNFSHSNDNHVNRDAYRMK